MKPFTPKANRICKLCGKEFTPATRGQLYCKPYHVVKCPICGKDMEIKSVDKLGTCCSRKCSAEKRKQTNIANWGVDNPAKSSIIKEKERKIFQNRYGVDTPFQMDDFRVKQAKTSLDKYGTDHPMKSDVVKQKHSNAVKESWGVSSPLNIPHVRQSMHNIYQDKDKLREIARKRSETRYNIQSVDNVHFDSSYEKAVYEFCKRVGADIEIDIPIEYEYQGKKHTTLIDFKIDGVLFECKGPHLLSGCFDYEGVPISAKLDVYKKHSVVIITAEECRDIFGKPNSTSSNGLKYKDKCPNPLIGVDIDLFLTPKFPYREDRPKCFYDVRVMGHNSSFEAFNDEHTRWKMIMNRIQYSGGFIDSNQILNALNITRTCKQPSWFNKSFAKELLIKYSTCDTVVDPFAGWGGRYEACKELGKQYVGCDLNSELVEWHQQNGRDIIQADAAKFRYTDECTVFICPPYQDVEVYFDGQNTELTQCNWLSIVMKNVPNAREYIMVCKIVDKGWENYIVESKVNKSHFGSNNEYVLVVTQN